MHTPPLSPQSPHSGPPSHSAGSGSDSNLREPWDAASAPRPPEPRLPPDIHFFPGSSSSQPNSAAAALADYQRMVSLMRAQPGWINPHIPRAAEAQASASALPSYSSLLEKELTEWVHRGESAEQIEARKVAEQIILESAANEEEELYLDCLSLGSLPDIFTHEDLNKFNSVQLYFCDLTSIPPSLLNHPNLVRLDIVNNDDLNELPEFGDMPKLEELCLSDNQLNALPESLGKLTNLRELKADGNQLETLPGSLNQLGRLTDLDISNNNVARLPDNISDLTRLTTLNLSNLELNRFPDVVCSLHGLRKLDLSGNTFPEYPTEIGQLQALRELHLIDCGLTSLPEEITRLPPQCYVDMSLNPFSQRIIDNLMHIENGPSIVIRNPDNDGTRTLDVTQPLETNVEKWISLTPEQKSRWQQLGKEDDAKFLNTWLENMEQTSEYCTLHTRKHVMNRMADLLGELTGELNRSVGNRELLPLCIGIANHATSTCVDQIAMGLSDMETALVSVKASRGEFNAGQLLAKGRELFISELGSKIADKKIDALKSVDNVDEVEVHLAFQIGLKRRLGLTLGSANMLFENRSQVKEEDLIEAESHIREQLSDEPLCEFLSRWDPMSSYLKKHHPGEWQALDQEFDDIESHAFDNNDWQRLNNLIPEKEARRKALCANHVRTLLAAEASSSVGPRQRPETEGEPPSQRFRREEA